MIIQFVKLANILNKQCFTPMSMSLTLFLFSSYHLQLYVENCVYAWIQVGMECTHFYPKFFFYKCQFVCGEWCMHVFCGHTLFIHLAPELLSEFVCVCTSSCLLLPSNQLAPRLVLQTVTSFIKKTRGQVYYTQTSACTD